MVGTVQEGQRESVHAVVDSLMEGGVPRGGVKRKVNVGGVEVPGSGRMMAGDKRRCLT